MAISSFRRFASRKFFAGHRLAGFLDQGNWNFYSGSANSSEKSQVKKLRMGPQEMLGITGNAADKERELLVATDMKENGNCSVYKFESAFDPSIRPSLELHLNKRSWICCQALDNYKKTVHFPISTSLDGILRTQHRFFGSTAAKVKRNPLFSTIVSDDINYFKVLLGEKNVIQDEDRLSSANFDWMHKYIGSSQLLLQPESTEQVSKILQYCNSRRLAVVPQGGNTGLVGGSVPVFDEVIINLGCMNHTISFDKVSGILVCEAGCILENLDSFLVNEGFLMPLDLGAKGSCQIGGNVSTNAGGLRFIRYGSLHGNVLGSEGTLGIITKVSILTPPKLPSINLAFLGCNDYITCQKLLQEAKRTLGEVLSAFEFLDSPSMNLVLTHLEGVRNPLPPSVYNFYVLMETTGSDESYNKEKLEAFLLRSMESGLISDGVVAQDINQASSFWRIREGITEALMKAGAVYKYDLSLPVEQLYNIVDEMRLRLGESAKVLGYGHLGDGNLHLNISTLQYDDTVLAQIEPFVYEWTSKHRGSISAEHGLGLMKANEIHYSKSSESVLLMASIKKLLDPIGIMNPYKVLPHSLLYQD